MGVYILEIYFNRTFIQLYLINIIRAHSFYSGVLEL